MNPIAFVFHALRSPENLGSIARVMKNFEIPQLVLAEPLTYAFGEAEKLAVKSLDMLETMRVEAKLADALAPYVFVAGTTSRTLGDRPSLTPEQLGQRLASERARGPVAVLFGSEKRGLSDAELELCQAVVTVPTGAEQPSINVAQTAAILAYEISKATHVPAPLQPQPAADRALMEALFSKMQAVLLDADFLNPQNPGDILDELRRLLDRAQPTDREAKLMMSAFRKLEAALQRKRG